MERVVIFSEVDEKFSYNIYVLSFNKKSKKEWIMGTRKRNKFRCKITRVTNDIFVVMIFDSESQVWRYNYLKGKAEMVYENQNINCNNFIAFQGKVISSDVYDEQKYNLIIKLLKKVYKIF